MFNKTFNFLPEFISECCNGVPTCATNATAILLCAFRESVRNTASSLDLEHRGVIVWRTMGSSQYGVGAAGDWNTGGHCNAEQPLSTPYKTHLSGEYNEIVREEVAPYVRRGMQGNRSAPIHLILVR